MYKEIKSDITSVEIVKTVNINLIKNFIPKLEFYNKDKNLIIQ